MRYEFFETIKVVDGVHLNVDFHQARYEYVLKSFGIQNGLQLKSFFCTPNKGLLRCRIVYNLDALLKIEYLVYKKRKINSLKLLYDDNIEYQYKSTSRDALDALFERRKGCDDVLVVKNGLITDTTIANIALEKDGVWYSPKSVLLEGTTRARYLQEKKIILKDIKVEELENYTQVALLNSMIDFDIICSNKGDCFVR